jgi:hypothetical protein
MSTQTEARFAVTGWDENTWDGRPNKEVEGAKLTRAVVTYSYSGSISGSSELQYLMNYNADGATGSYVALERVSGSLDGRAGSFTLLHNGTFDAQSVSGTVAVVPGSGSEALAGLRGTGSIHLSGHQETYPLDFEYSFAS